MKKPRDLPAPSSSTSTIGPIIGVVDGSNAAPGEVGEFLTATGTVNYAAYPTNTIADITVISIPPGDWDINASAVYSTLIGGSIFEILTPPPGLSNGLIGYLSSIGDIPGIDFGAVIIGQTGRGSFAVTTALTFHCEVFMSADSNLTAAGVMTLGVQARRRR